MQPRAGQDVAVVIPAAGSGTRLGGTRKQFRLLGGAPVLVQTVRVFERHAAVAHAVIVTPEADVADVAALVRAHGLRKVSAVVAGGATRQASVRRGAEALPNSVGIVLVHDGVRPFLEAGHVQSVIDRARSAGAAALAIPVTDTLRRGGGGWFGETVSREALYRMQTPQGFRRDWLLEAHARHELANEAAAATDDVGLVQRCGHPAAIVEGSPRNIKITTPDDWAQARHAWPRWEAAGYTFG